MKKLQKYDHPKTHSQQKEDIKMKNRSINKSKTNNKQNNLGQIKFEVQNKSEISTLIYDMFERIRVKNNLYDDQIQKELIISFFLEHHNYFKVIIITPDIQHRTSQIYSRSY